MRHVLILTDAGSVDPDDMFAIRSALESVRSGEIIIKGIVAVGHFSAIRAKFIKFFLGRLGITNIKVCAGKGIPYRHNDDIFHPEDRQEFLADNPLFPSFFGFPKNTTQSGETQWFPNFMKAYFDEYGFETINNMEVDGEDAQGFLQDLLGEYSPQNKLAVVCLSPVHDLCDVPTELYKNMDLYCMGGGFEENIEEFVSGEVEELKITGAGYNHGIAPYATQMVLDKLNESGTQMTLISSSVVRRMEVFIPPETCSEWHDMAGGTEHSEGVCPISRLTKTFMKDWAYCTKGNKLAQQYLCDPVTLYAFLQPQFFSGCTVPAHYNIELKNVECYDNYMRTKEGYNKEEHPLMRIRRPSGLERGTFPHNVNLVYKFDEQVGAVIISDIERSLFPHLQ